MMDIIPPQKRKVRRKKIVARKKRSFLCRAITVAIIFNLVFYQSFIPLSIAKAVESVENKGDISLEEEVIVKQIEEEKPEKKPEAEKVSNDEMGEIVEIEKEDEIKDEDKKKIEDDAKEISTDDKDLKDDILLDEEPSEESLEKSDEEENYEKTTEKVENENQAIVENDFEVNVDTGNNKIEKEERDEIDTSIDVSIEDGTIVKKDVENIEDVKDENEVEDEPQPCMSDEIEKTTEESGIAEIEEESDENVLKVEEEILEEKYETENDTTIIETGVANGIVNIFNEINSNITGENWEEAIYNLYGDYIDDINLLEQFLELLKKADEDSEKKSIDIGNENEAVVENNIEINVNTGNNEINSEDGEISESNIVTGDANAEVNIVNFINQNITGNNWLFSVVNVFGNWFGDLIVPGEDLLEIESSSNYFETEITNTNESDIENNVNITVNTGENEISGGDNDNNIMTGDAVSGVEIVNIANQNTTGNDWFLLMVNNMGSWVGNIMNWNENAEAYNNVFSYDFGTIGEEEYINGGTLNVHNQNTASVENNINITVNTGGNEISGEGNANIETGNASAWANIFNFVNNNITGDNWFFGIVNVMGSWTGDVVFAYPDLEVNIDDGKEKVIVGETINYTIVYKNTGEAGAENMEVLVSLPEQVSYQSDTSGITPIISGNDYIWAFSEIEVGKEQSFNISAVVGTQIMDKTNLKSFAGIKTNTTEKELQNNYSSDETTVLVPKAEDEFLLKNVKISNASSDNQTKNYNQEEIDSQLEISRESNINAPVQSGYIAKHKIILENTGNSPIYGIEVNDKIEDEKGEVIVKYIWVADNLLAGEKVLVEYEILINEQINSGMYKYEAVAYGYDVNEDEVESDKAFSRMSVVASARVNYDEYLSEENADERIIPIAEAVGTDEIGDSAVLGVENDYFSLPFWVWLMIALSYLLMINWLLFPREKRMHLN